MALDVFGWDLVTEDDIYGCNPEAREVIVLKKFFKELRAETFSEEQWGLEGESPVEQGVTAVESIRDGTFKTQFSAFGEPHQFWLTPEQIMRFSLKEPEKLWRADHLTSFPFEAFGQCWIWNVHGVGRHGKIASVPSTLDEERVWRANGRFRLVVKL